MSLSEWFWLAAIKAEQVKAENAAMDEQQNQMSELEWAGLREKHRAKIDG